MLEERKYKLPELESILGSDGKQAVVRKLERYDVDFTVSGRGDASIIDIIAINNPFKVFCILELGFSAQTDFKKLRDFLYCYFNDDEFRSMPDEVKETRMRNMGYTISRQTISNHEEKFIRNEYIVEDNLQYYYYFAYHHNQIMTTREEYLKAWREHWSRMESIAWNSKRSINRMILDYGGIARKQAKVQQNAIYNKTIDYIRDLIVESMDKEIESFKSNI